MEQEEHAAEAHPLQVLLIEDSDTDAHVVETAMRKYMKSAKFARALTMKDGKSALQDGKADVLLLDLNLPDTTGPEDTYGQIKEWTNKLPVIIMTSMKDRLLARRMVYEGAADFLNKDIVSASPKIIHNAIEFSMERHAAAQKIMAEKESAEKESKEKDSILSCFMGGYSIRK
ncbi:MAG: response regulator [Alphaproteobacteria bacterium]|nr:response regulator [Alphaproteobacteria bacterium]